MKNNFYAIEQTELIELENNIIKQFAYQDGFVFKGKSFLSYNIQKKPIEGYGSCRACDCKGYISKHNGSHECKTCSHHYDRHRST